MLDHELRAAPRRGRTARRLATLLTVVVVATAACSPTPVAAPPAELDDAPVYGTGLLPEPVPPAVDAPGAQALAAPPAAVDLTAWAPPTGNQGSVNSCVAWSIAYTALGWYQRRDGIAGGALAPMYSYAQLARGRDEGSTFQGNLRIATTQGIDTRGNYLPQGDFDFTTQPTSAQRTNAARWKLSSYKGIAVDRTAISTSLAAARPVVIGMEVYGNFFSVSGGNSGYYDAVSGTFAGYHAVTALGYDSRGLRIQNSWGAGWGDRGFATLSWSFVRNHVFTAIEIGPFAPGAPREPSLSPTTAAPTTSAAPTTTSTSTSTTTTTTPRATTTTTAPRPVTTTTTTAPRPVTTTTTTAAPTVTAVTPRLGAATGGTIVTVSGTNLTGAKVTVGGSTVTSVAAANGRAVTFVTRAGTGTVPIRLIVGARSVDAGSFTYSAPAPRR